MYTTYMDGKVASSVHKFIHEIQKVKEGVSGRCLCKNWSKLNSYLVCPVPMVNFYLQDGGGREGEGEGRRKGGRVSKVQLQAGVCGGVTGATSVGEAKKQRIGVGASLDASARSMWAPSWPSPECFVSLHHVHSLPAASSL